MPEGPELHLASVFVNTSCAGLHFRGAVEKSEVNKNPEVPFSCPDYTISAVSRGKEVKLILTPVSDGNKATHVVFRFGMSGSFTMVNDDEIPKHAHLRFYTKDAPRQVLCFVDPRRFGTWVVNGLWNPGRGPCVMQEYEKFRENVLVNLSDKAFDKPICEALLNQKYFNGIGNYLRAEILFRGKIPPFMAARAALEDVKNQHQNSDISLGKKTKIKKENPDLLQLCHLVPNEVINLGAYKGYGPKQSDISAFENWLQCYFNPEMKTLKDGFGRTVWFQGDPGPLVRKGNKSQKKRKSVGAASKTAKAVRAAKKPKIAISKALKVKKEEVEEETVEDKALKDTRRRGKKDVTSVETEHKIKKEKPQRGKKEGEGEEKDKIARRGSHRGSISKTPSRAQKRKSVSEEPAPAKIKPRRPKTDSASLAQDAPKPGLRALRKNARRGVTA